VSGFLLILFDMGLGDWTTKDYRIGTARRATFAG